MKNKILFLFLIFIVLSSLLDAAYLDTGYITWKQPDGTEFIAREWGDEFFNWFETDEGYAIIQDTDGWYYYSKLDNRGEFSPSNKIVGKHKPTGFVKHLKRSMERINYLSAKQNEINQHRLEKYNAYKSEHGSGSNAKNNGDNRITTVESIKLGVFLVDFQVSQRYDYGKHYYDDMLFSQNEYNGEGKREPYDDDPVFGSLNDYIIDQTNGHHDVVGKNGQPVIVNGTDPLDPTKVDWFVLAHDQAYYNNIPYEDTCWSEIMKEIEAEFGLAEIESYDEIGIMFAGDDVSNWFWPSVQNAVLSNGDKKAFFIVPENDRADGDNDFTHIGLVAHEFCHVAFGFFDEYDGQINPGNHCLMAYGENNGPANAGGACPAPINPGYKVDRGWVSPTTIPYDSFDYQIDELG